MKVEIGSREYRLEPPKAHEFLSKLGFTKTYSSSPKNWGWELWVLRARRLPDNTVFTFVALYCYTTCKLRIFHC